jgi:type IV secretion system protein VirD4
MARHLTSDSLILGFETSDPTEKQVGFIPASSETCRACSPVLYRGDGHLTTIAPTGSGKGRGVIIPNLVNYGGSVIVIDPKGENYAVTADYQRKQGKRVVKLDPFSLTEGVPDRLNPIDLLADAGTESDCEALELAAAILPEVLDQKHEMWDRAARSLISALILHIDWRNDGEPGTLGAVYRTLRKPDFAGWVEDQCTELGRRMHPTARQCFLGFLGHKGRNFRWDVLSCAIAYTDFLAPLAVRQALAKSTFSLSDLTDDKPLAIYIICPPHRMTTQAPLLRLWISSLLKAVVRRRRKPAFPTLFMLDECASLGPLDLLRQALTLMRGYGLQVWTFWQNLAQLKQNYPRDWETILDNSAAVQAFGFTNANMSGQIAPILGVPNADTLLDIPPDHLSVIQAGQPVRYLSRPDYLTQEPFKSRAAENPLFAAPSLEPEHEALESDLVPF